MPAEYPPACIDQPLRSGLSNMIKSLGLRTHSGPVPDHHLHWRSRVTRSSAATSWTGQMDKTSRNTVHDDHRHHRQLGGVPDRGAGHHRPWLADMSPVERAAHKRQVRRLTAHAADFSGFRPRLQGGPGQSTRNKFRCGAFYLSYNDSYCSCPSPRRWRGEGQRERRWCPPPTSRPYPPGCPCFSPGPRSSARESSRSCAAWTRPRSAATGPPGCRRTWMGLEMAALAGASGKSTSQKPPQSVRDATTSQATTARRTAGPSSTSR